jgi:hypothetical protein
VRRNPSLKRSANGRPSGPVWRYAVRFRQPGPGALLSSPPQLEHNDSMDYNRRPVTELLRGPLLHTPQGWVVIATGLIYAVAALLGLVFGVNPLFAKTSSTFFVLCVGWPFITFLYFVRSSAPHFAPSKVRAVELAITAILPLGFAFWNAYV